jgi:hypothetical protein
MQVPVTTLAVEFARQAQLPHAPGKDVLYLQTLVAEFGSNAAMVKRDMRRLLERDPQSFLEAACRVLKECDHSLGAAYLADLLWSSARLFAALADPEWMPLARAIALAQRWVRWEPLLDIKLLQIGFSSEASAASELDIARGRRVLAILRELPAQRHILLPLANLLHSPHAHVRLTAITLYGRAANNPEWVRKHLADGDATVRAHAVTCLWGAGSGAAGDVLREAARDSDPRVAANALVGLHYGGAPDVTHSLHAMAVHLDPKARAAAAFAMGQTLQAACKPALQGLLKDRDPNVRSEALQALIRVHRCSSRNDAPPVPRYHTLELVTP